MSAPFDDDLRAASAAYRDSGARDAEPPAALDDAICAAARREVSARPASLGAARARRWQIPLATAAVVVLSVSVTLVTLRDKPELVSSHESAPAAAETAPVAPPRDAAKSDRRARVAETPARPQQDALVTESARPAPPPSGLKDKKANEDGSSLQRKASPMPAPAPVMPAPQVAAEQPAPAMSAPPAAMAPAPSVSASPAANAKQSVAAASVNDETIARERAADLADYALAGEMSDAADPERWLRDIERLLREGHQDEARQSFERFRQRYPQYAIPDALRRALAEQR